MNGKILATHGLIRLRKAAVNSLQSKRFARYQGVRRSRSVWTAVSLALLVIGIVSALLAQTLTGFAADSNAPAITLAELQQRLNDHVSQKKFNSGLFGVKIVSLESGKTVFEHDAEKLFSPASNCKLYTVALALDQLGGEYRIKTSLYATAKPNRFGTLKGDLIVFGRGDPGFNAWSHGNDIFQVLEPLVAALTNAGVKRISGDLVGDESFFRGPPYGSGWDCDDLEFYYGAELSALTINDNVLKITAAPGDGVGAQCRISLEPATNFLTISNRTKTAAADAKAELQWYRPLGENVLYVSGGLPLGSSNRSDLVTMHNPSALFAAFFKEALRRHGIKVGGKLRSVNWLDRNVAPLDWNKLIELGSVQSKPLREIAGEIMKPSQNLYTDLLLAHVGALALATNSTSLKTAEDAGIEQLKSFLAKAGVAKDEVHFEEGSGLSRNNLTTPNATVALLTFMAHHAEASAYRDSLPIAGVDGTLRNRMKNTVAAGNVRAKTGTLRWANSLSGYVTTAAGEPLVFSIMVNRVDVPVREAMDFIAVQLAEFAAKSEP